MTNHRIVSLIASATEIICALGFESLLVGRSHECDYPPSVVRLPVCSSSKVTVEASSAAIDGQVRALVGEGLSVYRVDSDLLDSLSPSIIVTQTQCAVCAVSLKDVEAAVCALVKSQPQIVSLEPMSLEDVWADIGTVAAALGDSVRGDTLVSELVNRLNTLHARTQALAKRPSIVCIEWIDPLMIAGNWVPELVDWAGGVNLFGEAGTHSGYHSMDQVAAADPDVIAVMPCGFDIERTCIEMTPLVEHPSWKSLSAVRNDRVHIMDGNQYFNRPGPRVVESAEVLAECLHPDSIDYGHKGDGWQPWSNSGNARGS